MPKKKVLIFIDWYLPGFKAGGPIQSVANLVAHLRDELDISIITRDTDYCETTPYPTVRSDEWNELADGTKVFYFSENGLTRAALRRLIRQSDADAVYLNGIFSLYFTLFPLYYLRKKKGIRIVIAARGMLAESALGVKKAKKQFFLSAVKVLKLFDDVVFHASTENEKKDIHKVFGNKVQVRTAGNLPQKNSIIDLPLRKKDQGELLLINVARISPEKNLLFALLALQEVKEKVLFDFYGPVYDTEYWQECQTAIAALPSNVKASYKGSLENEKVLTELSRHHFMFMPTRGENFGHIILQSFAAGCPVIISDQTPWKKLNERNAGWDLELSSVTTFAKVIDRAAQLGQEEYSEMSAAAFRLAAEYRNDPEIEEQSRHLFIV